MPATALPTPSLPITPSVADKVTAAGTWAANTAVTTAAPAMGSFIPGANPTGAGGIEIAMLGDGILVFVQALQTLSIKGRRFNREKYGIWVIIALGLAVCWLLWANVDHQKAVVNGAGTIWRAFSSFGPMSKLGVLGGQETLQAA